MRDSSNEERWKQSTRSPGLCSFSYKACLRVCCLHRREVRGGSLLTSDPRSPEVSDGDQERARKPFPHEEEKGCVLAARMEQIRNPDTSLAPETTKQVSAEPEGGRNITLTASWTPRPSIKQWLPKGEEDQARITRAWVILRSRKTFSQLYEPLNSVQTVHLVLHLVACTWTSCCHQHTFSHTTPSVIPIGSTVHASNTPHIRPLCLGFSPRASQDWCLFLRAVSLSLPKRSPSGQRPYVHPLPPLYTLFILMLPRCHFSLFILLLFMCLFIFLNW